MVVLSVEFSNIRLGYDRDRENIDRIIADLECMKKDYMEIWSVYNYPKGSELFLEMLDEKIGELKAL